VSDLTLFLPSGIELPSEFDEGDAVGMPGLSTIMKPEGGAGGYFGVLGQGC
jgi:hypothetical protein